MQKFLASGSCSAHPPREDELSSESVVLGLVEVFCIVITFAAMFLIKTQKNQGTGAFITVFMRPDMGFNSSAKLGTPKQMFMLQTLFLFVIHCNEQDCTCQTVIIFSDST